jgi:pimeloyl-ACP methyl ester carboxylesterase
MLGGTEGTSEVRTPVNGVPYYWRQCGSGPLLVLLHGGAAHSGWFQWVIPRLAQRYWVIAPDLRGHGRTGHADRYTWDSYAEDIETLVGLLVGEQPYYLAGHCSGGYIGMLLSARGVRPPAALVGLEVRPKISDHEYAYMWAASRRPPSRYRSLDRVARAYSRRYGMPLDQGLILATENYRQVSDGAWVSRSDNRTLAQEPFQTYELATQVECPMLLVRGGESPVLTRIQFLLVAGQLRYSAFEEIPRVGHHLMVEDPDTTCALLEQFLKRVAQPSPARQRLPPFPPVADRSATGPAR